MLINIIGNTPITQKECSIMANGQCGLEAVYASTTNVECMHACHTVEFNTESSSAKEAPSVLRARMSSWQHQALVFELRHVRFLGPTHRDMCFEVFLKLFFQKI